MSRGFRLTAPGGPPGWPLTGPSQADAAQVLGRRSGEPVYVLGIDQAQVSGWAVHDLTRCRRHGVVTGTHEAEVMLDSLGTLPGFRWHRVLVVLEDHSGIKPRGRWTPEDGAPERNPTLVALGLGDARGGWRVLLDQRGQPKAQRMLVAPKVWRRVIMRARKGMTRADWKRDALGWASLHAGVPIESDDEAEAMAISVWGATEGLHRWASERLARRAS